MNMIKIGLAVVSLSALVASSWALTIRPPTPSERSMFDQNTKYFTGKLGPNDALCRNSGNMNKTPKIHKGELVGNRDGSATAVCTRGLHGHNADR